MFNHIVVLSSPGMRYSTNLLNIASGGLMSAQHKVVSHDEWTEARKALLAREKEFSRQREALARERRDLPWEEVAKEYVFDGPDGKLTLPDLFGDCGDRKST